MTATPITSSKVEGNFHPYYPANQPSDTLLKGILSGDLPKAYRHFSGERLYNLRVQAALAQQGYSDLLIGDKNPKYAYGLDGKFLKNSNRARREWLANNSAWIDKPWREIDAEILRRSHHNLGVANAQFPDASEREDRYFLSNNTKVPSVKEEYTKRDGTKVVEILSYEGFYKDICTEYSGQMKEARRLYEKGIAEKSEYYLKESEKLFISATETFYDHAFALGRGLKTDALREEWRTKVMNTARFWNDKRTSPVIVS